jgi:hypothetical protein
LVRIAGAYARGASLPHSVVGYVIHYARLAGVDIVFDAVGNAAERRGASVRPRVPPFLALAVVFYLMVAKPA